MDKSMLAHRNGFTLIGVLVALAILTTATVIFSRFIATRDQAVVFGRQTVVAASLAREGLELVRAIRDSNYVADPNDSAWLRGICENKNTFLIDAASVRRDPPQVASGDEHLWQTTQGEWTHDANGTTATGFSRIMTVDCTAKDDPAAASVIVTATVQWNYLTQPREVILTEKLFNWLPRPNPTP